MMNQCDFEDPEPLQQLDQDAAGIDHDFDAYQEELDAELTALGINLNHM